MRLYRIDLRSTPGSRWAGTQADARQVAKEAGTSWIEVDVPTDKTGLLAFLNVEGKVATETAALNSEIAAPPPAAVRAPVITGDTQRQWDAESIADFLLDRASVAQVENVLASIGARFGELAKSVRRQAQPLPPA